ncbi:MULTISPECIES: hypothetical protein [unclassified Haladaptatus]|uniref:DUF7285 family protein n=1 Tax=unclassified Haladaptatus TaxID=2622732 RepID=UPI00209BD5F0|nr:MULTISPECIES: hypothetical protein [unclassified Haladaptatus]MCO8246090.1 hypothetical protein [Haladaptatus sp. AB643]MCO8254290.1 hypothetical protein [Haladaptatus sp. AB618]
MRRWSRARAQTEPIAALVAVFAVCLGLLTYTGVLGSAMPRSERTLAPTTLSAAQDRITSNEIVHPDRLEGVSTANPDGYHLNVTLSAGSHEWHEGPIPPKNSDATDAATATVSVHVGPGDIYPGTLRVVVWP